MNETQLGIEAILDCIPHRYPFLLVDRILSYEVGKNLKALKNVSVNEPYFNGHFPGNPVMPGVLLIESLAQAGAILAYYTTQTSPKESIFYLASLDNVKFKQIVKPGDQLMLNISIMNQKRSFWKIFGEAFVDDQLVCSVEILSAMRNVESDS